MAKTQRPVKGTFAVKPNAHPIPHEEGFRLALSTALAKTGWDPGDYPNVRIEQFARIEVVNPGRIIEYCVVLTPPPPTD
jgi:hypothetical protein